MPTSFRPRTSPPRRARTLVAGVGAVQTRWDTSIAMRTGSRACKPCLLDGHFAVEQPTRESHGWLITFNGTAGVWRRETSKQPVVEQRALSPKTSTEPARATGGLRHRYLHDVVVPAELPLDSNAFRAQPALEPLRHAGARKMLRASCARRSPGRQARGDGTPLSYAAIRSWCCSSCCGRRPVSCRPDAPRFGLLPARSCSSPSERCRCLLFYVDAQRAAGVRGSHAAARARRDSSHGARRRVWRSAMPVRSWPDCAAARHLRAHTEAR